ncbi:MAG: zinc-dependent peptidase [Hydrogenimonas sp.]|nr:zinc-dependent peptidase [Hydrogenimonas sp.]
MQSAPLVILEISLEERVELIFMEYELFGFYAAVSEAEFFAVASERFFQRPSSLKKDFPEIYRELMEFYRLDTASIFSDINF